MSSKPIICIIGAGAVGGYYGARLAQHGHDVHFLLRSDFDAVRRNGWRVKSCDGDFTLAPGESHVHDDPRNMPKADLVLVTLKTTANDQFEPLIRPLVKEDTAILTLQNGLGSEERLAALFGKQHILGGMAFTCINRVGAGVIDHMAEGWVRIGEFGGGPSARARRVAELFCASKIDCKVLDNLRRGRWEKLSWNIPFNGLGAVMDLTTDRLIGTEEGVALVLSIMQEVADAARALDAAIPEDLPRRHIDKTKLMGAYQTSMQVDRREGRLMEVEAILGEPLRQGTGAGVAMPRLKGLYEMAKAVNQGHRIFFAGYV
ncbi:MAG TPA: 2-dehydropantoate 2-reductase [Tepidisphaeraceae bacterium]|jgi:2-dehydropantoate 2-reductase|nr:2-dehydropantoate 2-reductase [Tepidisphaeraceae bacterium]